MTDRLISLIGLPRTGKSTYLGALWLLVQDSQVEDVWEEDVAGDRGYVDALGEQVANGLIVQRTEVESDQGFRMKLGFEGYGVVEVDLPDVSGEAVRELVEERVWHKVLAEAVSRSDALILFVHPDHIAVPTSANFGHGIPTSQKGSGDLPDFSPDLACTAAKLIELLENILEYKSTWPLPISVVISAWDRVSQPMTPREWLELRLPGVNGVLEANPDLVRHSVFGISAQGGKLPDDQAQLLEKDLSERVFAFEADGAAAKLHSPLSWAVWSQDAD